MRVLTHEEAAELLAADRGPVPSSLQDAEDVVIRQLLAHGGNHSRFADELAQEYGDYPETAAAHMQRCLAAVPDQVVVPDWPERDEDGRLYTGMVDE